MALQVRSVVDLFYGYLKKGCCDGLCEARLKALTTLHLRGMHFKVCTAGAHTTLNCVWCLVVTHRLEAHRTM